MGIFRCQEAAIMAMGFERKFSFDTIYNMSDPQFFIKGKWYWLSHGYKELVAIDHQPMQRPERIQASNEWDMRPTAVRDGDSGQVIELKVKNFAPPPIFMTYAELYMVIDGLEAVLNYLDSTGLLAREELVNKLTKLLPPKERP